MGGLQVMCSRSGREGVEGGGDGGGRGGSMEDPLPRLHVQGWRWGPAVAWAVMPSCRP